MVGEKNLKKTSLFFLIIFIIFSLNLATVFSLECKLYSQPLQSDQNCEDTSWTCVLSLYDGYNSHIAECNPNDDYRLNVCCREPGYSLPVRYVSDPEKCGSGETGVISYYKDYNSHASLYSSEGIFDGNKHVCLSTTKPYTTLYCGQNDNPGPNDVCLFSLASSENSHAANYQLYPIKICCGSQIPHEYLTVDAAIDYPYVVQNAGLGEVAVTRDDIITQYTDSTTYDTLFEFTPESIKISVQASIQTSDGQSDFSHFWDHDCEETSSDWFLDTNANPFTFKGYARDRTITAFYRVLTKIENLRYEGTTIKGNLLDVNNHVIVKTGINYHSSCSVDYSPVPINGNVDIYYYDGNTWQSIGSVESDQNGKNIEF